MVVVCVMAVLCFYRVPFGTRKVLRDIRTQACPIPAIFGTCCSSAAPPLPHGDAAHERAHRSRGAADPTRPQSNHHPLHLLLTCNGNSHVPSHELTWSGEPLPLYVPCSYQLTVGNMFEPLSPLVEDPQPDAHRVVAQPAARAVVKVVKFAPVMTTQRRRLHEAALAPSAHTRPPPSMAAYMEGRTGVVGTDARVRLSLCVRRGGGVEAQTSVVQQIRALTPDGEWPTTPPPDVTPPATVTERVSARVRLTLRVSREGVVSAQPSVVPRPTIYGHVALLQLQPPSCAERRLRRTHSSGGQCT
jgi:hypothetical protein